MERGRSNRLSIYGNRKYGEPGVNGPQNLTYEEVGDDGVRVTWEHGENAIGYRVYDENSVLIEDIGFVTEWSETGYVINEPKIRKFEAYGEGEGVISAKEEVTLTVVMPAPVIVIDDYSFDFVDLSWASCAHAVNYEVRRSDGTLLNNVGVNLSASLQRLDPNTDQELVVRATAASGVFIDSEINHQVTDVIPVPSNFTAGVTDFETVEFNWTVNGKVDAVKIYDKNGTIISDTDDDGNVSVSGFSPNTEFEFYAVFEYKTFEGAQTTPNQVLCTFAEPPSIASLSEFNGLNAGIVVGIDAKNNPGDTLFEIYSFTLATTIFSGTGIQFDHEPLTIGDTHQYQVRAQNRYGVWSVYSSLESKVVTYPDRVFVSPTHADFIHGNIMTIGFLAPDGYGYNMKFVHSLDDLSEDVDAALSTGYTTTMPLTIPNKYGRVDLLVKFIASGGEETPVYRKTIHYVPQLQQPDIFVTKPGEYFNIEAINMKPGGHGTETASEVLDGISSTYLPKEITGLPLSLFAVAKADGSIKLYDRKWEYVLTLNSGEPINAISFNPVTEFIHCFGSTGIVKFKLGWNIDHYEMHSSSFTAVVATDPLDWTLDVVDMDFSTGNLYTASGDGKLRLYLNDYENNVTHSYEETLTNFSANITGVEGICFDNDYIYIVNTDGYIQVIDVKSAPKFATEISTGLTNVTCAVVDRFYVRVLKNLDTVYRYVPSPRMNLYKCLDLVSYSEVGDKVSINYLDETANLYLPPPPILDPLVAEGSNFNADELTVNITMTVGGLDSHIYYKATVEDAWGFESIESDVYDMGFTSDIDGYSIICDTVPDTVPDDTIDSSAGSQTFPVLSDAAYYIHAKNITPFAVASTVAHIGPFYRDTQGANVLGIAITPNPINVDTHYLIEVLVEDVPL